uniref:uncharacterized protein LOC113475330 n=1 Tax=Ciona intestinalis TaxID=7719 RepID=UPI000EF4D709|nr:uncharacterized protein LOC113475330 [Ciona intestinalis]|eukprot:XP_026695186.1 uncharacterized protein LOC113475330 [Ciona intestinalis]
MFWLLVVVLIIWPAGTYQLNGYSTIIQRSSEKTIHSTTWKQNLTINYKVCLNWKPYHIKATAQPKDTSRVEKFKVTVVKINFYNAVLELERIDEESGWGEILFTVQWAIYQISDYITSTATVQYRVDYDTDVKVTETLGVSKVYDHGLSSIPATQYNPNHQPQLSREKQNGHRFLVFKETKNCLETHIDLNRKRGEKDLFSVFIVYRIDTHSMDSLLPWRGLFGIDNGGFDKFIGITSSVLRIAGTVGNVKIRHTLSNADPKALHVWNVISVQWNVNGGANASSVWCNGKLLQRFQAKTTDSETSFAIGAFHPTCRVHLEGAIGEFVLFKGDVITDDVMKKYHSYFIEKWGITADPTPV